MKTISVSSLCRALGISGDSLETGKDISGVSTDSRAVKPGDCFFALRGPNFDGSRFVDSALDKGAVCAVVDKSYEGNQTNIIRVDDTITALGKFANYYRNKLSAKVIGITGSAGKTTVREIVHHALSGMYNCHQAIKSFNNNIGLPLTLLGADEDHEIIVAELGSNGPGEIEYLAKIAEPDIALVNNIYPAHLEGFGSIETIIAEKASIFLGLKEGGSFLINGDYQPLANYCRDKAWPFTTFGNTAQCDIRAGRITSRGFSGSITIEGKTLNIPLPGKGNLYNALAAWAICRQFDISIDQFAESIAAFKSVSMRMQIEKFGSLTILNDCYNANPASMKNALASLAQIASESKAHKVFICGTMGELGTQSAELHRQLGAQAVQYKVDTMLCIGNFAQEIADRAARGAHIDVEVFNNMEELCNNLKNFINSDDIILVKGSRSVGLERAVAKLKELSV